MHESSKSQSPVNARKDTKNDQVVQVKFKPREATDKKINDRDGNQSEPPPIDKTTLLGLIAVYFSVFLDTMGISIVQPVLPFYAEKFGANSLQLGALYSSYSLMAAFASYAMGKASDKFGRRPSILFSLFGTMVGFTVTGLATNYETLLAYRFLTGAFGASHPIAHAYITDVVPSTQRPKYLAFTGGVMALSFIVGPGIGSGLSTFGIRIPFFVSGGLGAFGLIFSFFVLRESNPNTIEKQNAKKTDEHELHRQDNDDLDLSVTAVDDSQTSVNGREHSESVVPLLDNDDDINNIFNEKEKIDATDRESQVDLSSTEIPKEVKILGCLNILNMMGWTSYVAMFGYYLILKYGISTLALGYITLSSATLYVFTNVVIFNQLSKRIGVYMCAFTGLLIFSPFLAILPLFNNIWLTVGCIGIGACLGNGLVFPSISAMAADYTNPNNRGKVLAFSTACLNIGRVIGPMYHGFIYQINPDLVFYSASIFVFLAWICIVYMIVQNPQLRYPKKLKVNKSEGIKAKDEQDWEWIPDKPTKKDYQKLGKFLGKMLSNRNYNWVSHYDPLTQFLKDIFPPVRTSSLKDHIEDIQFLRSQISNMRTAYDVAHSEQNVTYC